MAFSAPVDRTVVILDRTCDAFRKSGQVVDFELKARSSLFQVERTLWTCCVEGMAEYLRICFDLFSQQAPICVVVAQEEGPLIANDWSFPKQNLETIFNFLETLPPHLAKPTEIPEPTPSRKSQAFTSALTSALLLLSSPPTRHPKLNPPSLRNRGRIIYLMNHSTASNHHFDLQQWMPASSTPSAPPFDEHFSNLVSQLNSPLHSCELLLLHTAPLLPPTIPASLYSQPPHTVYAVERKALGGNTHLCVAGCVGADLPALMVDLAILHFHLRRVRVSEIPMKESASSSSDASRAIYDVVLLYHDTVRGVCGGLHNFRPSPAKLWPLAVNEPAACFSAVPVVVSCTGGASGPRNEGLLKWRPSALDKKLPLNALVCATAFRVTPVEITSGPSNCIMKYVTSGKIVLLESAENSSLPSHALISHDGDVFLHYFSSKIPPHLNISQLLRSPSFPPLHDPPPSQSLPVSLPNFAQSTLPHASCEKKSLAIQTELDHIDWEEYRKTNFGSALQNVVDAIISENMVGNEDLLKSPQFPNHKDTFLVPDSRFSPVESEKKPPKYLLPVHISQSLSRINNADLSSDASLAYFSGSRIEKTSLCFFFLLEHFNIIPSVGSFFQQDRWAQILQHLQQMNSSLLLFDSSQKTLMECIRPILIAAFYSDHTLEDACRAALFHISKRLLENDPSFFCGVAYRGEEYRQKMYHQIWLEVEKFIETFQKDVPIFRKLLQYLETLLPENLQKQLKTKKNVSDAAEFLPAKHLMEDVIWKQMDDWNSFSCREKQDSASNSFNNHHSLSERLQNPAKGGFLPQTTTNINLSKSMQSNSKKRSFYEENLRQNQFSWNSSKSLLESWEKMTESCIQKNRKISSFSKFNS